MSELSEVLKERGTVYGPYGRQVGLRQSLIHTMTNAYFNLHNQQMEPIYIQYIWDIMNKMSRIACSPDHEDSWRDIAGYATLILKDIQKRKTP